MRFLHAYNTCLATEAGLGAERGPSVYSLLIGWVLGLGNFAEMPKPPPLPFGQTTAVPAQHCGGRQPFQHG